MSWFGPSVPKADYDALNEKYLALLERTKEQLAQAAPLLDQAKRQHEQMRQVNEQHLRTRAADTERITHLSERLAEANVRTTQAHARAALWEARYATLAEKLLTPKAEPAAPTQPSRVVQQASEELRAFKRLGEETATRLASELASTTGRSVDECMAEARSLVKAADEQTFGAM